MKVTIVILTLNEELNIKQSVSSVINWAYDVLILDSGSTDNTIEIAEKLGAKTFYRKFDNYAKQRSYAISSLPIKTEWMLFLDADEYLTPEIKHEIDSIEENTPYAGYYLKRKFIFLGKWIKYGGYYPIWILRLFRKDKASVDRDMNEHIVVEGKTGYLNNDFIHNDNKGVSDWINKHNKYAQFEAEELFKYELRKKHDQKDQMAKLFGSQAERKRWLREYIWNPLIPPLIRPFIYFLHRYFFKLGFLDGKTGFIFHFLQGLWFYFLIDVKYIEMKKNKQIYD